MDCSVSGPSHLNCRVGAGRFPGCAPEQRPDALPVALLTMTGQIRRSHVTVPSESESGVRRWRLTDHEASFRRRYVLIPSLDIDDANTVSVH